MRLFFLVCSLCFFTACASWKGEKSIAYKSLLELNDPVKDLNINKVKLINNQLEFAKVYAYLGRTIKPGRKIPAVDFTNQSVLVISHHIENDRYNSLEINKISLCRDALTIEAKETLQANLPNTAAVKFPFRIIVLETKVEVEQLNLKVN